MRIKIKYYVHKFSFIDNNIASKKSKNLFGSITVYNEKKTSANNANIIIYTKP